MNKKIIAVFCSVLVLLSMALSFALPFSASENSDSEDTQTPATDTGKEDLPELPTTPDTRPKPIEFSKLCIINSIEDLYAFKAGVEGGESFKDKTVLLCTSLTAGDFSIAGTFSGTLNALGNTLTLKDLSAPLFSKLDGAKIENLILTVPEHENLTFNGDNGAVLAEKASDSDFILCKLVANEITLTFTPTNASDGGETDTTDSENFPENGSETDHEDRENIPGDGDETEQDGGENGSETETDGESKNIFALYALTAENCRFINCFAGSTAGSAVHTANSCTFKNICLSGVEALCTDCADCSYVTIVSDKPIDCFDGEYIINDDSDTDALATLLNSEGEKDPELAKWEIIEGALTLHFHSFITETTPKSCITYEKTAYICCDCAAVSIVILHPEKGHSEHQKSDIFTITEPTCTEKGYTKYECKVCKALFRADEVKETGHKTTTVGKVAATCVDKGYTGDKVCKVCGEIVSKGKATKPTGVHTWRNPVVTLEPTPDSEGEVTYYCLYCPKTRVEKISSTGHEQVEEFKYLDEQYHDALCSCGERHLKEAHDYKKIGTVKEPTADEKGVVLYRCSVCLHEKEIAEIDALGHKLGAWVNYDDENHCAKCSCGDMKFAAHKLDKGSLISDGISDKTGIKKVLYSCTVCTYQTIEEIPVSIPEDPKQIIKEENIKKYSTAIAALLIIGGALAFGYTKYTDKR